MAERFEYHIGDRTFYQEKLSLYQTNEVAKLFEGQEIPEVNQEAVIKGLGGGLTDFLSVVLIPQGVTKKEFIEWHESGDREERRKHFMVYGTIDLPFQVVEDFFDCNQVSSLIEKFGNLVVKITGTLRSVGLLRLNGSAPSLEEETQVAA